MRTPDQYLAVVVAVLFFTGLVMTYFAVRQRSASHRDWDAALVGTRGPVAPQVTSQKVEPFRP